jgi:Flp pilus assembly protein TadD
LEPQKLFESFHVAGHARKRDTFHEESSKRSRFMKVPAGTNSSRGRTATVWAVIALAVSLVAAYHNSLGVPFVLDDISAIQENASIRRLWPMWSTFSPPPGTTVAGRPVANLTLALNFALGGTDPWSYHAVNLVIHFLSGVTLFGIVRRTLRQPMLGGRFGRDAAPLAFTVALLWSLHPLQTEAVTYVIQRVESLMGLFYLLTLYLFIRSVESPASFRWRICAVVACLLGMATKESMVTLPILALLYDRAFVSGTFTKAWKARRGLYLALGATWLPLAFLASSTGWTRGGSAGFSTPIVPAVYWLTQCEALCRYVWLSLWPHPLVFDYGTYLLRSPGEGAACALVVAALAAATVLASRPGGHPALGFLGAWILLILAPSSVVPVATQTVAEHRMYLPLAAAVAALVMGVYSIAGGKSWVLLGLLALALGTLTCLRNECYRSAVSLWSDTVAKRPDNARAHCSLGMAFYSTPGGLPQAIAEFEAALRIQPEFPDAQNDLGMALEDTPDRADEAIWHFNEALRMNPNLAQAHYNLGIALARAGRVPEAIGEYEAALRVQPDYAEACNNLGNLLCSTGQPAAGVQQLEHALRIRPGYAKAHFDLGNALVQLGEASGAVGHYEEALRLQPEFAEAHNNLGMILFRTGHVSEGILHLEEAIRIEPDSPRAHFALGTALLQVGRRDAAISEFETVMKLRPNDPSASSMLERIKAAR